MLSIGGGHGVKQNSESATVSGKLLDSHDACRNGLAGFLSLVSHLSVQRSASSGRGRAASRLAVARLRLCQT